MHSYDWHMALLFHNASQVMFTPVISGLQMAENRCVYSSTVQMCGVCKRGEPTTAVCSVTRKACAMMKCVSYSISHSCRC